MRVTGKLEVAVLSPLLEFPRARLSSAQARNARCSDAERFKISRRCRVQSLGAIEAICVDTDFDGTRYGTDREGKGTRKSTCLILITLDHT